MASVCAVTALDRRWHRFDVEYRLPSDLPASIKARDGRLIYTASASVTIVRALSRAAPASWSASVQCWSPDVHFAVKGTHTFTAESAQSRPISRGLEGFLEGVLENPTLPKFQKIKLQSIFLAQLVLSLSYDVQNSSVRLSVCLFACVLTMVVQIVTTTPPTRRNL